MCSAMNIETARGVPQTRMIVSPGVRSVTIALLALGCTALPFVSPQVCGVLALILSGVGLVIALGGLLGNRPRLSMAVPIVGLIMNGLVALVALQAIASGIHVIDRFERDAPRLLGLVCLSPFAALLLIVGAYSWRRWRTERDRQGKRQ